MFSGRFKKYKRSVGLAALLLVFSMLVVSQSSTVDSLDYKRTVLGIPVEEVRNDTLMTEVDNLSVEFIRLKVVGTNDSTISFVRAGNRKWRVFNDGNDNDILKFRDVDGDALLTLDSQNFVGINTRAPMSTLDIKGVVRFRRDDTAVINSTGGIFVNHTFVKLDTFGGASTDSLTGIVGGSIGDTLIIQSDNNGRDVTLVDGGSLRLAGDFTLTHTSDKIVLIKATPLLWDELSRSNNG